MGGWEGYGNPNIFSNVFRYLSEREESKIKVIKESQKEYVIRVSNSLDDEIYNIPLTLKITLSKVTRVTKVTQNGESLDLTKKGNEILINVSPNSGDISIRL